MFKFLDKYFIKEFIKVFCFIVLILFPFVFFADIFLHISFSFKHAFLKLFYRYTCLLSSLLFISICFTVRKVINQNSKLFFCSLGCGKFIAIKALIIITFMISFLYYFLLLPSNELCFQQIKFISTWKVIKYKNDDVFYLYKGTHKCLSFMYKKDVGFVFNKYDFDKMDVSNFDIIWIEPVKMSINTLNLCLKIHEDYNWNNELLVKQKCIFLSKFLIFFMILLLGYAVSLYNNFILQVFILFFINWIEILLFFLTLKYCIILLCLECVFCILLSIYFLF